jgi:hypothetical protein
MMEGGIGGECSACDKKNIYRVLVGRTERNCWEGLGMGGRMYLIRS